MALDGAVVGIIKNDLLKTAIGARVEKITMPYKDTICLFLNKPNFKKTLLICANPNSARVHYTTEKYENPATPPMLCMLLRKRLGGGRLKNVSTHGIDRVLILDFDCKNELGDDIVFTVIVELLGRAANVIFVENGKIVDCVKRVDPEENKRFVLPNAEYEFPPTSDRINLFESDVQEVADKILSSAQSTLLKAVSATIDGLSPIIYRELCFGVSSDLDLPLASVNAYQKSKLIDSLEKFKSDYLEENIQPNILRNSQGEIKDFTFIPVKQYGESFCAENYPDIHLLLQDYFSKKDADLRIKQISASVSKTVQNLISRTSRKIEIRKQELKKTEKKENARIYGELIKANLHLIKSGDDTLECINYYDEECKTIRVPLDVTLSPVNNAHKYFKEYRKLSTAAGMLNELIQKAQSDKEYFESVKHSLETATTPSEVEVIRDELIEGGYIRTHKTKQKKKPYKPNPERFISTDGFEIYVGKNNYQNDYLTLKLANKNDVWFHTKNIPGSHCVVISDGKEVPESTLTQAAILAATFSKASGSASVAVDYTKIKNVKKPSGAKPGMVIYKTNQTAFVTPDLTLANQLKEK